VSFNSWSGLEVRYDQWMRSLDVGADAVLDYKTACCPDPDGHLTIEGNTREGLQALLAPATRCEKAILLDGKERHMCYLQRLLYNPLYETAMTMGYIVSLWT